MKKKKTEITDFGILFLFAMGFIFGLCFPTLFSYIHLSGGGSFCANFSSPEFEGTTCFGKFECFDTIKEFNNFGNECLFIRDVVENNTVCKEMAMSFDDLGKFSVKDDTECSLIDAGPGFQGLEIRCETKWSFCCSPVLAWQDRTETLYNNRTGQLYNQTTENLVITNYVLVAQNGTAFPCPFETETEKVVKRK